MSTRDSVGDSGWADRTSFAKGPGWAGDGSSPELPTVGPAAQIHIDTFQFVTIINFWRSFPGGVAVI
jgi:hypothetical protein